MTAGVHTMMTAMMISLLTQCITTGGLNYANSSKMNYIIYKIPRGKDGHNTCAKFRLVWYVLVHNINSFVIEEASDLTIDKNTWASMSYR